MMKCVDDGGDLDYCVAQYGYHLRGENKSLFIIRMLENFRSLMETGIPELQVPPMDPIHIELIDFKFFNLTIEFLDVYMRGFKNFTLEKSSVDREERLEYVLAALSEKILY